MVINLINQNILKKITYFYFIFFLFYLKIGFHILSNNFLEKILNC